MYVKICTKADEEPDITFIECDRVRFHKDAEQSEPYFDDEIVSKDVRLLEIHPTNKRDEGPIQWLVSGDQMQVFLMNNEGKTIDRLW